MSKSVRLNEDEFYPYLSYDGYIGKVILVVEGFYDLIKYPSKVPLHIY